MNVMSAVPMDAVVGPAPVGAVPPAPKSSVTPAETPAVVLSFLDIMGTLLGNNAPADSLLPPNASSEEESEAASTSTDDANAPSDMLLAMQAAAMPVPQIKESPTSPFVSRLSTSTTFVDTRSSNGAVVRLNITGDGLTRRNAAVTSPLPTERTSVFEFLPDTSAVTGPSQASPDAINQNVPMDAAAQGVALDDLALNGMASNDIVPNDAVSHETLAKDLAVVDGDLLASTAETSGKSPVAPAAGTMLGGEDAPTSQQAGQIAQHIDVVYAESRKAGPRSSKRIEGEATTGYQESMLAPIATRTFDTGPTMSTAEPAPASVVDHPPEAPAAPFSHVTVRLSDEAGGGQVVISLRGGVLRARIVAPDETATRAIERGLGELQGALVRHGFEESHVTVETRVPAESVVVASSVNETLTASKEARQQETSSRDRRENQRPYDDPRSGSRQESNGRSHQRARQERER